jgi:hypothetical protein
MQIAGIGPASIEYRVAQHLFRPEHAEENAGVASRKVTDALRAETDQNVTVTVVRTDDEVHSATIRIPGQRLLRLRIERRGDRWERVDPDPRLMENSLF